MKKGVPSIVQRTLVRPPSSRLGPITDAERERAVRASPVFGQYERAADRDSAYEILTRRAEEKARAEELQRELEDLDRSEGRRIQRSRTGYRAPEYGRDDSPTRTARKRSSSSRRSSSRQTVFETAVKQLARTVSSQLDNALVRGILGSMKKGR